MKLYSVRDVKADAFGAPMSIATEGLAKRSFADACQDERSELCKYAADYQLYELADYEPNSGEIKPLPVPKFVASALEYAPSKVVINPVQEVVK